MNNKEKNNFISKNAYYINPFSLYAISWTIVLIVYNLEWSYLYPKLNLNLLFFLLTTICISIYYSKNNYNSFCLHLFNERLQFYKVIKKSCLILYILLFAEFIIGGIPFFSYGADIEGNDALYQNWGIPIVNVIVTNGFSVLFLFSVSVYFLSTKNKNKVRLYILLSLLPPIMCMQRGIALNMIVGAFCIYIMQTKNLKKSLLITISLGIIILYGFGMIGQKRMNGKDDLILQIGEPTKTFEESNIPKEYFWSYLYISSPLANLQSIINEKRNSPSSETGLMPFIGLNIIPQSISKYFYEYPQLPDYKITPALTVGSTFFYPFYQLGWIGMWLMFFYIILFLKICMRIVQPTSPFRPVLIAILCEISFFGIFDNMTAYAAMYPQLILIYFGSKYLFR